MPASPRQSTPPETWPTAPTGNDTRPLTRDDILTAREVGELLQLPTSTIYYLARQGQLPAKRVGRALRFLKPNIEQLLQS